MLRLLPGLLIASSALATFAQSPDTMLGPIHVTVDVTDAPRKILHAQLTIPVRDEALTPFPQKLGSRSQQAAVL